MVTMSSTPIKERSESLLQYEGTAEGFLQRINKMGGGDHLRQAPPKAIPMGHSQVRRQQEVEVVEENTDMEEGAWDSIDWKEIADLRSNPKKFKKKTTG